MTTADKPFTHADLKALRPCHEALEWARTQPDAPTAWQNCNEPSWLFWILARIAPLTKEQSVSIAVDCAELELPKFEAAFPNDKRPRDAIQAAKTWLVKKDEVAEAATWAAAEAAASAATSAVCCQIIRKHIPCPFAA